MFEKRDNKWIKNSNKQIISKTWGSFRVNFIQNKKWGVMKCYY